VTVTTGAIVGPDGLCVDDNGRVRPNGNAIQLFGCNGTPAQQWTFATDGTVQVLGKCMQVTKPVIGGRIILWDCDGSTGEVWHRGDAGTLVNVLSGLCLDDPATNQQWGTQLDIATCTAGARQAWTLP
jgi:chitinase